MASWGVWLLACKCQVFIDRAAMQCKASMVHGQIFSVFPLVGAVRAPRVCVHGTGRGGGITMLALWIVACISMSNRARSFATRRARHACQDRTTSPTSVGRARHAAAFFFLFGWRCVRVQGHADAAQRICSGVRSEATSRHPHRTRAAPDQPRRRHHL